MSKMIIRNKNKTIIIQRLFAYLIVLKYIVQKQTLNPNPSEVDEILNNITLAYDPFGRRVSKTVQGEKEFEEDDHHKEHGKDYDKDDDNHNAIKTTYYVYDNEDIIMEYNHNGKVTARYTHGLGIDEPLAFTNKHRETYFYHADGLGSITALTDKKQHVVQSYEYDSFGNIKQQGHNMKQPYTYTGRIWDEDVKLYDYRNRDYDPKIGRFITKDPSLIWNVSLNIPYLLQSNLQNPQKLNPYVYTLNNPVNFTDPWGLFIAGCKPADKSKTAGYKYGDSCVETVERRKGTNVCDYTDDQIFSDCTICCLDLIENNPLSFAMPEPSLSIVICSGGCEEGIKKYKKEKCCK